VSLLVTNQVMGKTGRDDYPPPTSIRFFLSLLSGIVGAGNGAVSAFSHVLPSQNSSEIHWRLLY
jgi:hypothetical protein